MEDLASYGRILNNMSNVYEHVYDFESAIECQLKRMDIVTDLCDINAQIKCAAALGGLFQLKGEFRNSIMYYDKVIISLKMKKGNLITLTNVCFIYFFYI